jgi:lipopolysaccharide/colanic/teichoic acid biosynthesis glycosyltransferase
MSTLDSGLTDGSLTGRAGAPELDAWYGPVKAALDFVLAAVLLVLTAPIALLAMLAVKLTSHGPVLYTQRRLGLNGRPFLMFKVRTMTHNCESTTGVRWCVPGDPRVTAVGRVIRKTHLDELPQFWNILKGEMSLIGPRPERPEFVTQLERALPRYAERLSVRPGLTGLAQVQLPADTDLGSVRRKLAYDLFYVAHQGLGLDLRILLATATHVLGCPFELTRRMYMFPTREHIVDSVLELPDAPELLPHIQAA